MEYFKKLQCYKPKKAIIDSPISIEEVALLQDSVDKTILGRIKFINRSKQSIIAIFVHLSASNIAGENVPVEKERYIYQDMKIDPGELYGNKIPLHLPDDTRLLTVKLEKVVFENGEIWDAATGTECEYIPQEEIDIPAYLIEKVQEELSPHFSHMEYIHYFYEEGQNFWECTCGKINGILNKKCSFCQNDRQSQKEYLIHDKLNPLIAKKEQEKQAEDEEKARQEAEARKLKKEKEQREYERKQKEWEERQIQKEAEEQKQAIKRLCIGGIIVGIVLIVVCIYAHQKNQEQMDAYKQAVVAYDNGDYEEAVEKFEKASGYEDAKEKMMNSYDKIVEMDKEKLRDYLGDSEDDLINVLCYLGKPKEYIEEHTEFVKKDDSSSECSFEYDSIYKYVQLQFDEQNEKEILEEVSFYGHSDFITANYVNIMLNKEYDEDAYGQYTWDTVMTNKNFSRVVLNANGSLLDSDNFTWCEFKLSFYK